MAKASFKALLVGPLAVAARVKRESKDAEILLAIDGGLDACLRSGLRPELAIGDWDSVKSRASLRKLIHKITLPREKDRSDLAYALEVALDLGATEIACLGVTGGRPDHQIASLQEIAIAASRTDALVRAGGEDGEYFFVAKKRRSLVLELKRGTVVSVFPLLGVAKGVSLTGFQYPLKHAALHPGSRGLSNVVKGSPCTIRLDAGILGVVVPKL